MPLLGAHMSIAGGVDKALERGRSVGCDTIQIFTKNNNRWSSKPLTETEIRDFAAKFKELGVAPVFAHDAYLINLCAANPRILEASIEAFRDEMERAHLLGLSFVVTHAGAHTGAGEEWGIEKIAESLNRVFNDLGPANRVKVALETTAGQGTCIGYRFEQLARIIEKVKHPGKMGVCIDTCHVFAAGYDIRTRAGYDLMMREVERRIGFENVLAFHLNDSKKPVGSRVDRHEHIGKGFLGLEPFRMLLNDPRFKNTPMVLETPKGDDLAEDRMNLETLKSLIGRNE